MKNRARLLLKHWFGLLILLAAGCSFSYFAVWCLRLIIELARTPATLAFLLSAVLCGALSALFKATSSEAVYPMSIVTAAANYGFWLSLMIWRELHTQFSFSLAAGMFYVLSLGLLPVYIFIMAVSTLTFYFTMPNKLSLRYMVVAYSMLSALLGIIVYLGTLAKSY